MMAWAKFTYSVFISKENLEKYAIDSKKITSFSNIANLLQKPGWTVGALFDPVPGGEWVSSYNPTKLGRFQSSGKPRQQNSYDDPEDSISIRYVALGSLLHMIQDSYSDSHTDRGSCGTLFRNKGKIRSFRNYANQKADDHGIADVQPEWLESGLLTTDNPIWASAKIIQFASKKTAWEEGVEEFLDKEVFFLEDPQKLPEPGSRECFEGRDWN